MEAFTGPTSVATAQLTCEMDLTDPYKADCLSYLLRECSLTLKSCTDVSCLRGFPPLSLTFIMPASRGERGWMGQGLDGTEWLYVSSCNDRNISFSRFRKIK
jgi:hypothetical protein